MEKRTTPRVGPWVTPCKIVVGEKRLSGYVLDLSLRGAQVSSNTAPPDPGVAVTLELRLGGAVAASRIEARVRWVQPPFGGAGGMHHFGLGFAGEDEDTALLLQGVLEEFRRRAAELA